MLNCFNATRLMSESRERPLRFREKSALKLHTMMCSGCRNFDHHLTVLHKASVKFVNQKHTSSGVSANHGMTSDNDKKD